MWFGFSSMTEEVISIWEQIEEKLQQLTCLLLGARKSSAKAAKMSSAVAPFDVNEYDGAEWISELIGVKKGVLLIMVRIAHQQQLRGKKSFLTC